MQEKNFIKNIVNFGLFDADTFVAIESEFLKRISVNLSSRYKLMSALKNISTIALSSFNYITFDEWKDPRKREFLGLTICSYIEVNFNDFFRFHSAT